MAWTKSGPFWVDRRTGETAFSAALPSSSPGAKPIVICAQDLYRLPLIEAVAVTTGAHLLEDRSARGMAEVARGACAIYEKLVTEAAKGSPPVLACRKGCSFCCHLDVSLSHAEVCLLVEYLSSTCTPDGRALIKDRSIRRRTEFRLGGRKQGTINRAPCPLLENGACTVYGVRPLHCRGANSKDAGRCERGGRIDAWPAPLVLANSIACGLDVGSELAGVSHGMCQLDQALGELL